MNKIFKVELHEERHREKCDECYKKYGPDLNLNFR